MECLEGEKGLESSKGLNLMFGAHRLRTLTGFRRENLVIVDLRLDPIHQVRHISRRRQSGRLFVFHAVRPEVLESTRR